MEEAAAARIEEVVREAEEDAGVIYPDWQQSAAAPAVAYSSNRKPSRMRPDGTEEEVEDDEDLVFEDAPVWELADSLEMAPMIGGVKYPSSPSGEAAGASGALDEFEEFEEADA